MCPPFRAHTEIADLSPVLLNVRDIAIANLDAKSEWDFLIILHVAILMFGQACRWI